MLQLFLCCPRMNLLSFTLTTYKGAHPAARVLLVALIGVANFGLWSQKLIPRTFSRATAGVPGSDIIPRKKFAHQR